MPIPGWHGSYHSSKKPETSYGEGQITFISHDPPVPMIVPLVTNWSPMIEWQAVACPQSLQPGLPSYLTTSNFTPAV